MCRITSPKDIDADFHDMLLEVAEFFEEQPQGIVPWWTKELCRHRDDMYGLIIIQEDPPILDGVFFLWGKKNPLSVSF